MKKGEMVAVTRKRIPKPTKTWQAQALIDLVPFLNAKPRALLAAAKAWTEKYATSPGRKLGGWYPEKLEGTGLEVVQRNLREAMKSAYAFPGTDTEAISDWMTEAWKGITIEYLSRPGSHTLTYIPSDPGDGWQMRLFKGLTTVVIGESMGANIAFLHGEDPDTNCASGKAYVGVCKRCETVFEKKTKRQEFCSTSCQEALKQARHRERKINT